MSARPYLQRASSSSFCRAASCQQGHWEQALELESEHDLPAVWMLIQTRGGGGGGDSTSFECLLPITQVRPTKRQEGHGASTGSVIGAWGRSREFNVGRVLVLN